jgi:hypothetical protein
MTTDTQQPVADFFIVGAMKSGTSSLRDMLRQHPDVDIYRGEIHYFDKLELFEKGPDWYHEHFDLARGGEVLHGDKSPSYSLAPEAPARIQAYNPAARIIWIFRNPVKRAISNFHHAKKRNQDAMSLEDSLSRAEELAATNSPAAYLYRSQYERHLANFALYFSEERNYIMIFEELLADPETEVKKLLQWLGLTSDIQLELPHSNEGRPVIKRKFPVTDDTVTLLEERLAPTVAAIEARLGREIAAWRR